ncbi:unnamed protein product [Acidithrix sp. C25]|nr:unnamed protein product [Acidithrix sp. C25]
MGVVDASPNVARERRMQRGTAESFLSGRRIGRAQSQGYLQPLQGERSLLGVRSG